MRCKYWDCYGQPVSPERSRRLECQGEGGEVLAFGIVMDSQYHLRGHGG